jgi:hypothetical protein
MKHARILSFAFSLLYCGAAGAQTVTGSLDGHITDQGGAFVPQVQVTAKNLATGVERSTTSNDAGYYQMPFLPLGQYQVTASLTGFTTVIAGQVDVTLNRTTTVNLSLRVSAVRESVTVTDVSPLIDVTSGQIRRSLEDTMVTKPAKRRAQLPVIRHAVPRISDESDLGTEQLHTVQWQFRLFQRHRNSWHDFPDGWSIQRRRLREPEPAARQYQHHQRNAGSDR